MLGYERPRALHGSSRSVFKIEGVRKISIWHPECLALTRNSPLLRNQRGTCGSCLFFGRSPEGQPKNFSKVVMVLERRARMGRAKNCGLPIRQRENLVTPHAWGRRRWQAKMRRGRYCVSSSESIQCFTDVSTCFVYFSYCGSYGPEKDLQSSAILPTRLSR